MARRGILFCMRYPDDEGFVWNTVARLRDMVAGMLIDDYDCYIAFPKLTGRGIHHFDHLKVVELDCYALDAANKKALKRLVELRNISAIVYMSALPATLDLPFLHGLRLVTINTEEDSFDHNQRDSAVKQLAKFIMRRVLHRQLHDLHIANSQSQGDWLVHYAQIPHKRLAIVPNGVDCSHFEPPSPASPRLLDAGKRWVICASQARAEKRVDLILRCAARICAKPEFANVSFVCVGDGKMLPQWRQLARDLEIEDRVLFAGRQLELCPYYQSSTLMVHAAERESFGLVLAEAMACGLPVVASAAAGPRDIIDHGKTGTLVAIDDEEAFGAAIELYLRNPVIAREHGMAGRARAAERFSIHRQARDIAAAITRVVAR